MTSKKSRILTNGKPHGKLELSVGTRGGSIYRGILLNLLLSRSEFISSGLNQQGLDIDKECKYPRNPTYKTFWDLYNKVGLARRINDFLPDECWSVCPDVYETEKARNSVWEKAVKRLVTKVSLWSNMHLADKLCGIGQYGGLFLGFNDDTDLKYPVKGFNDKGEKGAGRPANLELAYLSAFHQGALLIKTIDTDQRSPRCGLPKSYSIRIDPLEGLVERDAVSARSNSEEVEVHWTRMIHLLDGRMSSKVLGTERMRLFIPQIFDTRKILGGSGEMFWKGGFPGISFETHPGMEDPDLNEDDLKKEIEEYSLGMKRYLRLIGMVAKSLAPQVADPASHMTEQYRMICTIIGCPMRVFLGQESGDKAGKEGKFTWNIRLGLRQNTTLTDYLVRPFFDRMLQFGCLPPLETPDDGYTVSWRDMNNLTEADRADFGLKVTQALLQYVTSGAYLVMPPIQYLTNVLLYSLPTATAMIDAAGGEAKVIAGLKAVIDATAGNTKNTTGTNPTKATGAGGQKNSLGKGKAPRGSKTLANR